MEVHAGLFCHTTRVCDVAACRMNTPVVVGSCFTNSKFLVSVRTILSVCPRAIGVHGLNEEQRPKKRIEIRTVNRNQN